MVSRSCIVYMDDAARGEQSKEEAGPLLSSRPLPLRYATEENFTWMRTSNIHNNIIIQEKRQDVTHLYWYGNSGGRIQPCERVIFNRLFGDSQTFFHVYL